MRAQNGTAFAGTAAGVAWTSGAMLASVAVGTGPDALAFDTLGNVWVANDMSANITKLSSAGAVLGTFAAAINPFALATDKQSNVWVVDRVGNKVLKFDHAGTLLGTVAVATNPRGIAFDSVGNAWVTSGSTNDLAKLTSSVVAGTTTSGAATWDIASTRSATPG
jgi:streptogramin lyase